MSAAAFAVLPLRSTSRLKQRAIDRAAAGTIASLGVKSGPPSNNAREGPIKRTT